MEWIIPANHHKYDHSRAFLELPYIDWEQGNTRFSKGDLVYIYSTSPICAIKFLAEVIEVNVSINGCLDDKDFWLDPEGYSDRLKCEKFVRLKLKETYQDNIVTRAMLEEHGLNARIQHAIKLYENNGEIRDYGKFIHQRLDSKSRDVDANLNHESNEKEIINELINNVLITRKSDWTGKREVQATFISSDTGRELPKREREVAVYALIRAGYLCEFDNGDRTFLRKSGKPYTEPHHLIPISKYRDFEYGLDIMENIVSLCSHCHNLLHYGRFEEKTPILTKLYEDRREALSTCGIYITLQDLLDYYK